MVTQKEEKKENVFLMSDSSLLYMNFKIHFHIKLYCHNLKSEDLVGQIKKILCTSRIRVYELNFLCWDELTTLWTLQFIFVNQ